MSYIRGIGRQQQTLLPEVVDDYIEANNLVRAVAAFVEYLDLTKLKFERAAPAETGRPGYDPRMMLGIYLWGHLNRIRSSRRLERECQRNLELIWLTGRLCPDFKTIANFRKDNGKAIQGVLVEFRLWCESEELYGQELAAIDGSKFKAVNSMDRNFTKPRLAKLIKKYEAQVDQYLQELAEADQAEGEEEEKKLTAEELQKKIEGLKERRQKHQELREKLVASGENQLSLTDADARLMRGSKGTDVCYNLQTAVDSKHKLIVAIEVTNACADQGQLAGIAQQTKEALGVETLEVVADAGYLDSRSLKECEEAGIVTYVPVEPRETKGIFSIQQFAYDAVTDSYTCPAQAKLTFVRQYQRRRPRGDQGIRLYATAACSACALRAQCTKSKRHGRRIERLQDQEVLDRQLERNQLRQELQRRRSSLIEHVFGTLKRGMGHTYFLTKGREKVTTETSLMALSYNFKRVTAILGVERMVNSWAARAA
jgi:transposase